MFLALREFRHARLRYGLITAILTLIALLVFLLSGLANGLSTNNGAALQHMNADYLVFQSNVRLFVHRSILPMQTVAEVKQTPGVKNAAPLGHLTVTVQRATTNEQIDATILAIDPSSFLAPPIVEGKNLSEDAVASVVVDRTFQRHGVKLGDTLKVTPSGQALTVTGFTTGQTYNHLPVIFTTIPLWQSLKFAPPGSAAGVTDPISVVAVQMGSTAAARVAQATPGVAVATLATAVQNLPGYSEEQGTLTMIQVILFLIAACIMAAFFYVLTLQKSHQFGIVKALGASSAFLARDLIGQVLALSVAGILLGVLLSYGIAALIPSAVPFALDTSLIAAYGAVLLVVALVGALLSLRQIAKVDALVAIGRMD